MCQNKYSQGCEIIVSIDLVKRFWEEKRCLQQIEFKELVQACVDHGLFKILELKDEETLLTELKKMTNWLIANPKHFIYHPHKVITLCNKKNYKKSRRQNLPFRPISERSFFVDKQKKKKSNTKLLAIWALKKLGFTNRAIANLAKELPISHPTIGKYYKIACKKIKRGEITILPKGRKFRREMYVGSSNSLQQLYAKEYQRPTGGGWQTPKRSESDNLI